MGTTEAAVLFLFAVRLDLIASLRADVLHTAGGQQILLLPHFIQFELKAGRTQIQD